MFNMRFKFSIIGLIIFMVPMLINIVYFKYPPVNELKKTENVNHVLELIEQVSRVLYAVAICILVSNEKVNLKSPWLYIGIVFLVLYYLVWIRYFAGGRDVALLGKSFLGIPQPLAIFPVLFFICEAMWVHNYIAVSFMVVFGVAHNIISYISLYK